MLSALKGLGLTHEAIAAALAKQAGRPAPSPQRVHDWSSGARPTPSWVTAAAAAHLCRLWEMECREVDDADLARCDARWAARLDPVLGELYGVMIYLPEEVRAHLRTLKSMLRNSVMERLDVQLPGV